MKPERLTSLESHDEAFPRLENVAHLAQIMLMKMAYEQRHPDEVLDMSNRDVRNQIALEWTDLYSHAFRTYIDKHPGETLNIHDPEALLRFLEKLSPEEETMH